MDNSNPNDKTQSNPQRPEHDRPTMPHRPSDLTGQNNPPPPQGGQGFPPRPPQSPPPQGGQNNPPPPQGGQGFPPRPPQSPPPQGGQGFPPSGGQNYPPRPPQSPPPQGGQGFPPSGGQNYPPRPPQSPPPPGGQPPAFGDPSDPYNPYDNPLDEEGASGIGGINPTYLVGAVGGLSMLIVVCLVVVAIILFSQGDDDGGAGQSSPTPAQIALDLTRTPQTTTPISTASSPTPLATANTNFRATPTPLQFFTSAPPPTLGTGSSGGSVQTAIGISSPVPNTTLRGNVTIIGSASHPNFVQYALEYGPNPNPSNLWYPITSLPITRTVLNNALGAWNTLGVADGNYQIRLHVWLNNRTEDFRVVSGLEVRNARPTQATANRNPQLSPISALTLTKGKAVTLALGMSDPDFDPLTYVAQTSNASLVTITPSGAAAITVNGLNVGTANVSVSISDGRGGTASTSFSVTVVAPIEQNNPPSIAPIPSVSLLTGQNISLSLTVTDPDPNDTVTLSVGSSAPSVTANVVGKNLTLVGVSQGTASVNVTATDSKGLNTTTSFLVTVTNPVASNNPPSLAPVGNQTIDTNKTTEISLTVSDPNNDPLTLNATSSNNGIVSALVSPGTNRLQLTGVSGGNASITVSADDKKGGVATISFNVTVNPPPSPNNPPTIASVPNQTLDAGTNLVVSATTSDPDGDVVSLQTSVSPLGIASVSSVGNDITIAGDSAGTATVTLTASDGTVSVQTTFTVTVNAVVAVNNQPVVDPIAPQSCLQGDVLSVTFSYSDPDGDPVTPIDPPSSTDANVATVSLADPTTLSVNCNNAGVTNIAVQVEDDKGLKGITSFELTVSSPVNNPPSVDPIGDVNCQVGETPSAFFTYNDPDGDTVTPVDPPVSDNSGIASVGLADPNNLSLNCVAAGSAQITVQVQDEKGLTANASFIVNVAAIPNNPPSVDPIGDVNCQVGETPSAFFTYNDPDGDTITPVDPPVSDNAGIASVSLADPNTLSLNCVAAGNAQITVQVQDEKGLTANASFIVNVAAIPNNPPSVDPIGDVNCLVGETPSAFFTYNDPDGDTVTPVDPPVSDNAGIASVGLADPNTLSLNCVAAGNAQITVQVQDDKGLTANASFMVNVATPANNPPNLDPIADVNCLIGETPSVFFSYNDPDGNPVSPINPPSSDNPGAVSVSLADPNTLSLNCLAPGSAQVTVQVQDDKGDVANRSFLVNVAAPANNAPSINFVDTQNCNAGDNFPLSFSYSDPDGDPVTPINPPSSDNPAVGVSLQDNNTLNIACTGPGAATITVQVQDDKGEVASFSFTVNVAAPVNNNPTVDFIGAQNCNVGEAPSFGFNYSDPDGDPLNPVDPPFSDNNNVATAALVNPSTIGLNCIAEGSANVTVEVQDGKGGSGSMTFAVNVSAGAPPPPTFDVTVYSEIPNTNAIFNDLNPVFSQGQNTGKQTVFFSLMGDESLANGNFLTGFSAPPPYNLGNNGDLENLINFYNSGSGFNLTAYGNGNGWTVEDMLNPFNSAPECNGVSPFECEINQRQPSVIFISFSPNNATATPKDIFQSNLQSAVTIALNVGVIPVLTTLPDDGSVDPAVLAEYNEVIATLADNAKVPLWNVYNTMQPIGSGQVYSVGNGNPFDLSDSALNSGVNRRNLAALRVLQQIKNTFYP